MSWFARVAASVRVLRGDESMQFTAIAAIILLVGQAAAPTQPAAHAHNADRPATPPSPLPCPIRQALRLGT